MSNFYVVATPIGNKEDITARAKRILSEVDIIACEDTRVSKRLLESYGIYTALVSYHAQSSDQKEQYICDLLKKGKNVALISDAGTPAISDPGTRLVARVHEMQNVEITVIPGPSAVIALLSGAGISTQPYTFYGFLPHKKGRSTLIDQIVESQHTSVVYESPHRVVKFLQALVARGEGDRLIVVGRELTKMYEQILRMSVTDIIDYFEEYPEKIKGEFVVAITGTKRKKL